MSGTPEFPPEAPVARHGVSPTVGPDRGAGSRGYFFAEDGGARDADVSAMARAFGPISHQRGPRKMGCVPGRSCGKPLLYRLFRVRQAATVAVRLPLPAAAGRLAVRDPSESLAQKVDGIALRVDDEVGVRAKRR